MSNKGIYMMLAQVIISNGLQIFPHRKDIIGIVWVIVMVFTIVTILIEHENS